MQVSAFCAAVGAAHAAKRLTRTHRDILFKLGRLAGRFRQLWPSHDWLAAAARCCRKTVVRALAEARALGLVSWRPQRWLNARGWRRGTNVYRLHVPQQRVVAAASALPSGAMGHSVLQERQALEEKEDAQGEVVLAICEADGRTWPSDEARQAARDALERVRRSRAAALGLLA